MTKNFVFVHNFVWFVGLLFINFIIEIPSDYLLVFQILLVVGVIILFIDLFWISTDSVGKILF